MSHVLAAAAEQLHSIDGVNAVPIKVTWRVKVSVTQPLTEADQVKQMALAFDEWGRGTPLCFNYVKRTGADIVVKFISGSK